MELAPNTIVRFAWLPNEFFQALWRFKGEEYIAGVQDQYRFISVSHPENGTFCFEPIPETTEIIDEGDPDGEWNPEFKHSTKVKTMAGFDKLRAQQALRANPENNPEN